MSELGEFVTIEPGTLRACGMMLTPSRWLPPVLRFTVPPVSEQDRETIFRALDAMAFGSCILPAYSSLEIIEPLSPCRTLLARSAFLGMLAPGCDECGAACGGAHKAWCGT